MLLLLIVLATLGFCRALPGLNATNGVALLLPFTITVEPIAAIAVLTTIYCAATFAGAITAILINTPGTSASATTCLNGYPLAQRGEAEGSWNGSCISTIGGINQRAMSDGAALLWSCYKFAPPEYFALRSLDCQC